ncbi:hypothetical protein ACMFMG_004466 [Clarireedia jacksonii]
MADFSVSKMTETKVSFGGLSVSKMSETKASFDELWADAARQFQEICGESLQRGEVKSFDDVRMKIENINKQQTDGSDDKENKWDKVKSVGLKSLKFMKILVGVASQAAEFTPIPSGAAEIAGSALSFVFEIPERIKEYNEAIDRVFTDVSSALAQLQIYETIDVMDNSLLQQIHLVMVSIVKICAHVVKYRQGCRKNRLKMKLDSIFHNNQPLEAEMSEFRRTLQAQRDVEGTVTLSVLVETRSDVVQLLEHFAVFSKTVDETHQGVQALKDDNDRTNILIKIRNTLQVPTIVLLNTRTTNTCTDYAAKCLPGTGSWIWTDDAFVSWTEGTAKGNDNPVSNLLIVSGPPSSGKTLATAQIIKRLEEENGRTYAAHYFFPQTGSKKAEEDNKYPVHFALRYMAFQIARVDATVRKALGKACDSGNVSALTRNSTSSLESLWQELKIGVPGSGATYFLVFDGIENLDEQERELLLNFVFSPKLAKDSAGRVRVLVSGTDKILEENGVIRDALQIEMEKYNALDMRIFIEDRLNKQGLLRHAKPGSIQQKAKDNVIAKLPQKAAGRYSQLKFALDEIVRLLSSRISLDKLDKVLDHPMNSHETAIEALQRSLAPEDIRELNEMLKWVHFSGVRMTVAKLEAAMILYSGTESIGLLQDIISSKYSAVLKIDDSRYGTFVEDQDGALEYLQKKKDHKAHHSKDRPTISMTINVNNVDQEIVGHFLWDLAQKAIRDQFRFNFDSASNTSHMRTIAVDEFEAHHTIVMSALKYLCEEPRDDTKAIGDYLFSWLPEHLSALTRLDEEDNGSLMPDEQLEIGRYLYQLFKDQEVLKRHMETIRRCCWTAENMESVRKWLMNPTVVRRLPKEWREKVQRAVPSVRGYLRPFVTMIVESWLRDPKQHTHWRWWGDMSWILEFMKVDNKTQALSQMLDSASERASSPSTTSGETPRVDWDSVSAWCQNFLELQDSELDSLWWDRIGQAAALRDVKAAMSLFKRALEKKDASWLCNYHLAMCYHALKRYSEAISEITLAIERAQGKEFTPMPDEQDIIMLHYMLGRFYRANEEPQQAAAQYLLVSKSNGYWAEKGQAAYMIALLRTGDTEGPKKMLRNLLTGENGEESMIRMLNIIARNYDHDFTMWKILSLAKDDPNLLRSVVAALEKATTPDDENKLTEMLRNGDYDAGASYGVLLYHRGMALAYGQHPAVTGSAEKALTFWHQCRDQLDVIGGSVASITRTNATNELAKYYLHSLVMEKGPPEYLEALSNIAKENAQLEGGVSIGYLAMLYVLRDDKEKARGHLLQRVKVALQILSDDDPDNDFFGYWGLHMSLAHYRDLRNSIAALRFMGQADLVTEALCFEIDDIEEGDGDDKNKFMDLANQLGKKISQAVKSQVPDPSQQLLRIEAANKHISTLLSTTITSSSPPSKSSALTRLQTRISTLQQTYPSLPTVGWTCDGTGPPGTSCPKGSRSSNCDMYTCIYCYDLGFCSECLTQLREGETKSLKCSKEHEWVLTPQQYSDFYCGVNGKEVKVPVVRARKGDEKIFEAAGEGEVLTLEEWKKGLAREWEIEM